MCCLENFPTILPNQLGCFCVIPIAPGIGRGEGGLGWPLANRRGGQLNEEASGTGQAISTQPTSQQSKVQVLTRGENSGPLGGNRAGQALSAHPTSPRPCF